MPAGAGLENMPVHHGRAGQDDRDGRTGGTVGTVGTFTEQNGCKQMKRLGLGSMVQNLGFRV